MYKFLKYLINEELISLALKSMNPYLNDCIADEDMDKCKPTLEMI